MQKIIYLRKCNLTCRYIKNKTPNMNMRIYCIQIISLKDQKSVHAGIKSSLFKDLQTTKPMDAVSDVITINAENISPL